MRTDILGLHGFVVDLRRERACAAAEKFISSLKHLFVNFDRHFAIVCAYIRVTAKANATGDPIAFKIMGDRLEEYNKSLHNIKYGAELFKE